MQDQFATYSRRFLGLEKLIPSLVIHSFGLLPKGFVLRWQNLSHEWLLEHHNVEVEYVELLVLSPNAPNLLLLAFAYNFR